MVETTKQMLGETKDYLRLVKKEPEMAEMMAKNKDNRLVETKDDMKDYLKISMKERQIVEKMDQQLDIGMVEMTG